MNARIRPTLIVLGLIVVASIALGLIVGEVELGARDVWEALIGRLPSSSRAPGDAVLWSLRVPRVLAGIVVGVGLGAGGATAQAFYRNPMADPYLLGISSAAGLGAVAGVLAGSTLGTPIVITVLASLIGAMFAIGVRRLAGNQSDLTHLVLVGLTLGIALLAWTVIVVFIADTPRLPTFTYFIFGSLGSVTWSTLGPAAAVVVAFGGVVVGQWRKLDLLALGEADAHHLGLDVRRTAVVVLGSVGALTGATVALAGVIGFVGLLAPILVSRLVGPSARVRIPSAAMAGSALVLLADVVSRSIAGPVEVPIGIVTAAVGGPVLVWLISARTR